MPKKICVACGLHKEFWKTRPSYCKDCGKRHNREWEAKHPDRVKARTKKKAHDPERQRQVSTYRKLKRRVDPTFRAKEIRKNREQRLKRKFGITIEQFEAMREAQGNVCAICGEPNSRVRMGRVSDLAVDHDHVTNKLRDLLCYHCNSGLGHFNDSPITLWRAIRYLRKHGKAFDFFQPRKPKRVETPLIKIVRG